MIRKKAISQTSSTNILHVSNIFPRPKKDGGTRTIINLKNLNKFIPYEHFKMESLENIKHLLKKGDLMVKIDLKDAYWSVPISKKSQNMMAFSWEGNLYKFLVMAFGLGPAPRIFTKIMKVPISILRKLSIRILIYQDDMLIMAESLLRIQTARDTTLYLLQNLGFSINWDKSILTPLPRLEFLGMIVDSHLMTISLPEGKVRDLLSKCKEMTSNPSISLRELSQLIGKLNATRPAVTEAPLQLRGLQQNLISAQRLNLSYEDPLVLNKEGLLEIQWWIKNLTIAKSRPIHLAPPQMIIETDASTTAWGAHQVGGITIGDH